MEGHFSARDSHTIILGQSWRVDVRVSVISHCEFDKQFDRLKDE